MKWPGRVRADCLTQTQSVNVDKNQLLYYSNCKNTFYKVSTEPLAFTPSEANRADVCRKQHLLNTSLEVQVKRRSSAICAQQTDPRT